MLSNKISIVLNELNFFFFKNSCAICLEDYEKDQEIRYLPCGHCFHSQCILQWLPNNKTCPFCKMEIDSKENPKTDSTLSNTQNNIPSST